MKHFGNRIEKANPLWKGWAIVSLVLLSVSGVLLAAREPKVEEYKPKDSRAQLAEDMFAGGKRLQNYRNEVGFDGSWKLDASKQP